MNIFKFFIIIGFYLTMSNLEANESLLGENKNGPLGVNPLALQCKSSEKHLLEFDLETGGLLMDGVRRPSSGGLKKGSKRSLIAR